MMIKNTLTCSHDLRCCLASAPGTQTHGGGSLVFSTINGKESKSPSQWENTGAGWHYFYGMSLSALDAPTSLVLYLATKKKKKIPEI